MLVLKRKKDEAICVGNEIRIVIVKTQGTHVQIGIEAPDSVKILREELTTKDGEELRKLE